ncbi:MAG: hypothetical protein ACFB11_18340 [Paracoccaceae bacterium]
MSRMVFLFACLTMTGCLPLSTYYKEGAPLSLVERDETTCQVKALRDAPVANVIRQRPSYYVPARKVCNSEGKCIVRGGYYRDGQIYTVDVNKGLRVKLERQCMADRGYAPVDIPACPNNVAEAAPPGVTTTLPRLSSSSCVIRRKGGQIQIVNRG